MLHFGWLALPYLMLIAVHYIRFGAFVPDGFHAIVSDYIYVNLSPIRRHSEELYFVDLMWHRRRCHYNNVISAISLNK